jgi:acetyl-CoA carboxylase biotin carboxyl carrier protein
VGAGDELGAAEESAGARHAPASTTRAAARSVAATEKAGGHRAAEPPPPVARETLITSPFVGTFYRSPSPDAAAFVEVGQRIKKGQVICIVEAMKLMNEIESEVDGTVHEILAENAHAVEYGQPLFRIGP